ncbi:MAG: energy transducer TonB [Paludibacteraceae bacterium]|jgi:TonB family protein|nr:energy transducer TonB [Paludibacteraceae bacterium]
MKKLTLILATLLMAAPYATAQEDNYNNELPICGGFPEKSPEFPGGTNALFSFLCQNLEYPSDAKATGEVGRVVCQFTIDKDGSIKDITILKHAHPSLDAEAVRVLSTMPNWVPAENNGKRIKCQYTMPIVFKIDSPEQDKKATNKKKKHKKQ